MSTTHAQTSTTTSFALLGLLALRDRWTTYELVKEMRRNVHYFWPRAESRVYDEAKRLVALGWARSRRGATGRRPRTVYEITPEGREALEDWLARPPTSTFSLQFEPLVRVLLAAQGPLEGLLIALRRTREDAEELLQVAERIGNEYLAGEHPFQEQVHVRQFVYEFLASYAALMRDWATSTEEEVASWRDTLPPGDAEAALERIRASMARSL